MNFIEAVKLLSCDRKVKIMRKSECYRVSIIVNSITVNYEFITDNRYGERVAYVPTVDDVLAQDWYVVKNEKLHTFEEALKAYKSGQDIRRKGDDTFYHDSDQDFTKNDVMATDWIILDK